VRRLLSTFAHGSAGAGLLVLRLAAGIALVVQGAQGLLAQPPLVAILVHAVSIGIGMLLAMGLWTQFAAALLVADALWHVYAYGPPFRWMLLAAMGAALTLLGPGAWSMDARRFGWRRVDLRDRTRKDPPAF
jgi:putative oxidoreductase